MRRLFAIAVASAGLVLLPALHAQKEAGEKGPAEKDDLVTGVNDMTGWKWANFAVLAGILIYYGIKLGNPYFAGQTDAITRDLSDARARRAEADARAEEVDRKLANLEAEIGAFRTQVLAEQAVHIEELRKRAGDEMERLRASAVQQIETAGKQANLELRRHASRLALEIAEQRVRDRMNPSLQHSLTGQFLRDLKA